MRSAPLTPTRDMRVRVSKNVKWAFLVQFLSRTGRWVNVDIGGFFLTPTKFELTC